LCVTHRRRCPNFDDPLRDPATLYRIAADSTAAETVNSAAAGNPPKRCAQIRQFVCGDRRRPDKRIRDENGDAMAK
jgi:hypothetical protein